MLNFSSLNDYPLVRKYLTQVSHFFKNTMVATELLISGYTEEHRYFHTFEHVESILDRLLENPIHNVELNESGRYALVLAALFHDIVYDPTRGDNEEVSAEMLATCIADKNSNVFSLAKEIILDSKQHFSFGVLSNLFQYVDCGALNTGDLMSLVEADKKIFKEYQFVNYPLYKENRIKFLRKYEINVPQSISNYDPLAQKRQINKAQAGINFNIQYVEAYRPNIGIYAGSFNPLHRGHLNIIDKASKIFDKVIIVIGKNPDKDLAKDRNFDRLKFREVVYVEGWLTDYIKEVQRYADVTLVRGLRNTTDFAYEQNQLRFYEDMADFPLKVIHIMCDREYQYISSSSIRALQRQGADETLTSKYL